MGIKKKIYYAVCFGFFVCGIFLCYCSSINNQVIERRIIISGIFCAIAYIMFPFGNIDQKDKILRSLGVNILVLFAAICLGYISLNYFFTSRSTTIWYDVLATLGILLLVSDLSYIIISFIVSFYNIAKKCIGKIMQIDIKGKYTTIKKVLTALTAFLATITALCAGFAALIKSIKEIM